MFFYCSNFVSRVFLLKRDNRELAFQQLQRTLALKDFELAQSQQRVSDLNNEVVELRKIKQREGINMDYLKNVVVQVRIIRKHLKYENC